MLKGDREVKAGSSTETKTFNRELTVPEYVDLEKMTAFLMDKDPARSVKSNFLMLEAPIVMEKYTYRRSAFDKNNPSTKSPVRSKTRLNNCSPIQTENYINQTRNVVPGLI